MNQAVLTYTSEREINITSNTSTVAFDTIEFTATLRAFDLEYFSQHDMCLYLR